MTNSETVLQAWRAEIVAEIETSEAELLDARARLHEAELTEAAAREHWQALNIRLARCTHNGAPLVGTLAMRRAAEEKTLHAAVGALTAARLQLANIEHVIAERRGALLQIDHALAPPAAPMTIETAVSLPRKAATELPDVIEFPRRPVGAATA
jgi:predicted aconitase